VTGTRTDVRQATQEDVAQLLRDPSCPRARVLNAQHMVPVLPFIAFARSRRFATSDIETVTDAYVVRVGGKRETVLDPWSWLPNLVRRATGRLTAPPEDVWILPDAERFRAATATTRPRVATARRCRGLRARRVRARGC
jgi:hypothetical protein